MKDKMFERIKEIKKDIDCPKNFYCLRVPEKDRKKVIDIGIEGFLECGEKCDSFCSFKCPFGFTYLCTCPMRNHLFRKGTQAVLKEGTPKVY